MEAPIMSEDDENFMLDSEELNEEWIIEKGRVLNKRHFLRIVGKDKKNWNGNHQDKPLIWTYLTRRNSNNHRSFHI